MFVILNVYDAKNSNIGSVAICRHLTIWLALGIPKRIICYHCSNWTNRRNDLTGPEDPIYYSDRMIWLCVLLLLMVKGFDYWIGTKIPQIALDYLTMLNTGQYKNILTPQTIEQWMLLFLHSRTATDCVFLFFGCCYSLYLIKFICTHIYYIYISAHLHHQPDSICRFSNSGLFLLVLV